MVELSCPETFLKGFFEMFGISLWILIPSILVLNLFLLKTIQRMIREKELEEGIGIVIVYFLAIPIFIFYFVCWLGMVFGNILHTIEKKTY